MQEKSVSRRTFVKATGALGALAAGTGLASNELFSAKTVHRHIYRTSVFFFGF